MHRKARRSHPPQSARSLLHQISQVTHNPDRDRFELWVAGDLVGVLGYRIDEEPQGKVVTILHTVLYDEFSGHGLATKLTGGTMAYMRENGLKVRPLCTFTRHFLNAHPGMVATAPPVRA